MGLAGTIRFVDLCAGLGGFHQALKYVEQDRRLEHRAHFHCVLASELNPELRRLYLLNFPEIAGAYRTEFPRSHWSAHEAQLTRKLGPLADSLRVYNDAFEVDRIHGDLRALVDEPSERIRRWPSGRPMVPEHDLLCAGFPCQPFSKSGAQRGFKDANGTVFHLISIILAERRPGFVLLENVGNFERHDQGNTWKRVKEILGDLGYEFRATTHVGSVDGGSGLLSPHHIGLPHHRERFFIAARHRRERRIPGFQVVGVPFPQPPRRISTADGTQRRLDAKASQTLAAIISGSARRARAEDFLAARVAPERLRCADHWQRLLDKIHEHDSATADQDERIQPMPSFPIWGFELDPWNHYPIASNPRNHVRSTAITNKWRKRFPLADIKRFGLNRYAPTGERRFLRKGTLSDSDLAAFRELMPGYAIARDEWPHWKQLFIEQNRAWGMKLWRRLDGRWLRDWLEELYAMPPSHQKFEWNCQGEPLDLWRTILQYRPSGLRTKRFAHVPALVAMTTTQVPVVPRLTRERAAGKGLTRKVRHLLPIEALQLQGFPPNWKCPSTRDNTFQALGNAVHAKLVAEIFLRWFTPDARAADSEEDEPVPKARRVGT